MTPFGQRLREIRAERGTALKEMAAGLQISAAYLSAMEHGHRGKPSRRFVHRVCQYLGIIWDEAEALQRLADISHPRIVVDTAGLDPAATELANRLAAEIGTLDQAQIKALLQAVVGASPQGSGQQGVQDDDDSEPVQRTA